MGTWTPTSAAGSASVAATPVDGWVDDTAEAWTFASATTFTVATDLTTKYTKGTRIKLTQTTVKYFTVTASSFGGGNTTVTITGGTDYTFANAAVSLNYHSYAANPQGYPGWFNYTPTSSVGFSGALTVTSAQFQVLGTVCTVNFRISGTSNNTTTPWLFSMPIVSKSGTAAGGFACVVVTNNSVFLAQPGEVVSNNSGAGGDTEFAVYRDFISTSWTASGTKGAWGTITYPI